MVSDLTGMNKDLGKIEYFPVFLLVLDFGGFSFSLQVSTIAGGLKLLLSM